MRYLWKAVRDWWRSNRPMVMRRSRWVVTAAQAARALELERQNTELLAQAASREAFEGSCKTAIKRVRTEAKRAGKTKR